VVQAPAELLGALRGHHAIMAVVQIGQLQGQQRAPLGKAGVQ